MRKMTTEVFIDKANLKHNDLYTYKNTIYTSYHVKLTITCDLHGDFEQSPANHLKGHGCFKCGVNSTNDKQTKKLNAFIIQAEIKHNFKYDYSKIDYKGAHRKIDIGCPLHGCFKQTANSHLRGHGCPKCLNKSQVKLYIILKNKFPNQIITYEASPKWLGRQRFDMYFPKFNIAIEYNGRQHYQPVKKFGGVIGFKKTIERDVRKRTVCKENDCKLLELKHDYTDQDLTLLLNKIENIIKNNK